MDKQEMIDRLDDGEVSYDVVIEKWQQIVDKDIRNDGSEDGDLASNCAFCYLYFRDGWCSRCPIFKKTNSNGCGGTPLVVYNFACDIRDEKGIQNAAVEMLEFLEKLKEENGGNDENN